MRILFASLQDGIMVSQQADGSLSWSGQYNGIAVRSAVPIEDGKRCILLLDPDANRNPTFENLLCIDQMGNRVWTAKLPTSPDVFVTLDARAEGIWANTWSGFKVLLDRHSGLELKRAFVK
jgi:hypothetical protein